MLDPEIKKPEKKEAQFLFYRHKSTGTPLIRARGRIARKRTRKALEGTAEIPQLEKTVGADGGKLNACKRKNERENFNDT